MCRTIYNNLRAVLCIRPNCTRHVHIETAVQKGRSLGERGREKSPASFEKGERKKESEDTRNRHKTRHYYYIALCMCLVYTSDLGEREFLYVCVSRPPHSNVYGMHKKKEPKSLAPQESLHRNFLRYIRPVIFPSATTILCNCPAHVYERKNPKEKGGKSPCCYIMR